MKELYVLVMWPESQLLMEQSWFNKCILAQDIEGYEIQVGPSAYFVPVEYFNKLKN